MAKLVLLTGFLGAGKTTFLNNILQEYKDKKIGIIVNEFSKTGVDGELIKKPDEGMEMIELTNGSIFCACIKDTFVNSLIELSKRDLEYAFIEASGLADPSSISSILSQIAPHTVNKYDYLGAVCLADSLYFTRYFALLPAIKRQVEYSKAVLINKVDLASEEQLKEVEKTVKEINPACNTYRVSYGKISMERVLAEFDGRVVEAKDSLNTEAARPKTITLKTKEKITPADLDSFIAEISKETYRIKGFCKTTEGTKVVSVVTEVASVEMWGIEIDETQLVIIASVGIKIISTVLASAKKYFKEPVIIE